MLHVYVPVELALVTLAIVNPDATNVDAGGAKNLMKAGIQ